MSQGIAGYLRKHGLDMDQGNVPEFIDNFPKIKGGRTDEIFPLIARIALAAVDTAGGVFAWQNPESEAILVKRILVDITTASSGACTLDCGPAANATTLNDTLIDGVSAAAAGIKDNIDDAGTNGLSSVNVAAKAGATDYVTGSVASGASAGIVGFAYIEYIKLRA